MKSAKTGLLWLLLFFSFTGLRELMAQEDVRGEACFVWYNVENLFYPEDDSASSDDEFTPQGVRHWTWSRYRDKLTAIAKVIIASGRGEPPELVGLCEVENARVLEELCSHPVLNSYQYSYIHRESKDHRGMDVACLVRREMIEVVQWESIAFDPPVSGTRDILHVSLQMGIDTLDLFLVHLLSKYGGAGATAALRKSQAGQLAQLMDSVYRVRQNGLIMAAGDFNEVFQGYAMEPLRIARFEGDSLTVLNPERGPGSYKFRGRWSAIDQVLVLLSMAGLVRVSILQLDPLLTEDLEFGGVKPRRSYVGMQHSGGISDHLPLVIDLCPFSLSDAGEH
jgi:endonuclease/exonuclease/phosphatase family metal-dependent hydrolase